MSMNANTMIFMILGASIVMVRDFAYLPPLHPSSPSLPPFPRTVPQPGHLRVCVCCVCPTDTNDSVLDGCFSLWQSHWSQCFIPSSRVDQMPWLWALTGNSLLDGHECVVGQISQLHPTASERGGPSLSLQLWKVSYLQSIPQPLPTSSPRGAGGQHRSCRLGAGLPFLHSGCVSPSSAAPA